MVFRTTIRDHNSSLIFRTVGKGEDSTDTRREEISTRNRKRYSTVFKAKMALVALKEGAMLSEMARDSRSTRSSLVCLSAPRSLVSDMHEALRMERVMP